MCAHHKKVKIKDLEKLRNNIVKNGHSTKSKLQTQCEPTNILMPFSVFTKREKIDLKFI